uniref:RNA pseudouridylate synthase domain-containing protein 1 n=1 Tax=Myxine glutinosa TaxID=7769 RepID=UPI00358E7DE7
MLPVETCDTDHLDLPLHEPLNVLYHSGDFLVLCKPWDVLIDSVSSNVISPTSSAKDICTTPEKTLTIQQRLQRCFPTLIDPTTRHGFRLCHQLDFSTSGVLCVALSRRSAAAAFRCFKERLATKAYLALVRGRVEDDLILDQAIGNRPAGSTEGLMCVEGVGVPGCENPKPCLTRLTVLQIGFYDGQPASKVLLQPITGRTHQLRVHCSAAGHCVVGDFTYSGRSDTQPYRMMLHAFYLCLPLPNEDIQVTSTDPFLPEVDPCWCPEVDVCSINDAMAALQKPTPHENDAETEDKIMTAGMEVVHQMTEEEEAVLVNWLLEWPNEPEIPQDMDRCAVINVDSQCATLD